LLIIRYVGEYIMRKSQVALEFLITYGWAILASMIAIGALTYFGISNPAKTLPDKCIITNNIECNDYIITAPNQVLLRLSNGQGQTIYNPGATVMNATGSPIPCNMTSVSDWAPDDILNVNCTVQGAQFLSKDRIKVSLTVNYSKTPTGFNQIATGELYTTVQ
jgi:uncharacterized protein (UPF0333 family)